MKRRVVKISDILDSRRMDVAYFLNGDIGSRDLVPLSRYVDIKGGKRIPKGESFTFEKTNYLYLRLSDVDDVDNINYEALKCISEDLYCRLKRYEITNNQIVFSIAGTIGKVFVIKNIPTKKRVVLTENCAMLQPKSDKILSEYISILLNCSFVQKQIEQNRIQTTIPKMGLDRIAKLKVPEIPLLDKQQEIVEIYSNAQKTRLSKIREAKIIIDSIDDYLLKIFGIEKYQSGATSNTPKTQKLSSIIGSRYDPHQFHPERIEMIGKIKKEQWCRLKDVRSNVKVVSSTVPSDATYIGMENIDGYTGDYIPSKEKEVASSAAKFKNGDILFPKLRPYLNKVHRAQFDGYCSTEFHVFEAHNVHPDYLTIVLRSSMILAQTKHLMTGNTLPRLQTTDVDNLILPIPDIAMQEGIVNTVNSMKDKAKQLQKEGDALLEEAKQIVEKMIIG